MKTEINWISINDRFPKDKQEVMIANAYGIITTAWYCGDNIFLTCYGATQIYYVTHWAELPKNPNKK